MSAKNLEVPSHRSERRDLNVCSRTLVSRTGFELVLLPTLSADEMGRVTRAPLPWKSVEEVTRGSFAASAETPSSISKEGKGTKVSLLPLFLSYWLETKGMASSLL